MLRIPAASNDNSRAKTAREPQSTTSPRRNWSIRIGQTKTQRSELVPMTPDDAGFAFRLGQLVTHRDQHMPSIILSRQKTKAGEIYGVRRLAVAEFQDIYILGEVLVPTDQQYEQALSRTA